MGKQFYWVRLPVLGELGRKAVVKAGRIERLHCVLDFVPSSRIFKIGAVIVEEDLAKEFEQRACTGFVAREAVFELSKQAGVFGKRKRLPRLVWLEVGGGAGLDDLGLDRGKYLIVSERVKELIEGGPHEGVEFRKGSEAPSHDEIEKMLFAEARALVERTLKKRGARPKSPFLKSTDELAEMVEKIRAGKVMRKWSRRCGGRPGGGKLRN